jgi:hypothetical protein
MCSAVKQCTWIDLRSQAEVVLGQLTRTTDRYRLFEIPL